MCLIRVSDRLIDSAAADGIEGVKVMGMVPAAASKDASKSSSSR